MTSTTPEANVAVVNFRIHGDNVVECERTLRLIEEGLALPATLVLGSSPLHPKFEIMIDEEKKFIFELLPGHGRWGIDIANGLVNAGSQLRENADSVITRLLNGTEEIILGIEFCGALPAGNQAWQRHGRALGFGQATIPYLIFTEIGGVELTAGREVIAHRWPNPATTYALLQMSHDLGVAVFPVYEPAASSTQEVRDQFASAFGHDDAIKIITASICGNDPADVVEALKVKTLEMVKLLSRYRSRSDTLVAGEWELVLRSADRFETLETLSDAYVRRSGDTVDSSDTAALFTEAVSESGATDFFSSSLPITWIPKLRRSEFSARLRGVYGPSIDFTPLDNPERNLVVIFVTGFKPRGDDSRPDRGLMPLGRMLAGPDTDVLTFLWGPAKASMLTRLNADFHQVARENGLIEASVVSSDFVLVDGVNGNPFFLDTRFTIERLEVIPAISSAMSHSGFGEHDVDSVIHYLATQPPRSYIFEGLCNPPGGDWSGISLLDSNGIEVRWTSLPRVSSTQAKRPDHVLQFRSEESEYVLALESKLSAADTESGVGPDLIRYVEALVAVRPNVFRASSVSNLAPTPDDWVDSTWDKFYSGATFRYQRLEDLDYALRVSESHVVIAIEYFGETSKLVLHLKSIAGYEFLVDDFERCAMDSLFEVEVQKH